MADVGNVTMADVGNVWPELDNFNLYLIVGVNIGSFVLAWFILRVVWKPPTTQEAARDKEMHRKITTLQSEYQSISVNECLEGDVAGDYSAPWTETFDYVLLMFMVVTFVLLSIWTTLLGGIWSNTTFWLSQLPKLAVMMFVSVVGGMICRQFCKVDENGYIITTKKSKFKVNYTRKLQHFAAYMVPLVVKIESGVTGPIALAWGDWFTMLGFLVLIKPIRESLSIFMIQFNSLDRPEDRPYTLKWIIAGNILPGLAMIIFFRWLFAFNNQEDLAFIFIFITGVGDGLAEPVGITWGKHKYWTASCLSDRKYQRSFEGSACVYISAIVFTSCMWYSFANPWEFWVTMIILPPMMAYAEATSPHTMDTPFLMGLGGLTLYLVTRVKVVWY